MKTHGALGALALGMAVIVAAVALRDRASPAAPTVTTATSAAKAEAEVMTSTAAALAPSADDEALGRLRTARSVGDERALVAGLASDDPIVALEAVDAMVDGACTACIVDLARVDPRGDARVAATAIVALGTLGAKAAPRERAIAVERLVRLLGSERARRTAEADANLLSVVEALGAIGDPRGVRELEALLEDRSLDLVTQLLVVRSIATPSASGRARLAAIQKERSSEDATDDFERELRRELDDAIATTLGG